MKRGGNNHCACGALRLAQFFGNRQEFWLNLRQMHNLSKARLELSKTIERDVKA
jgi:plasmid maintenance system antidote protein VapI